MTARPVRYLLEWAALFAALLGLGEILGAALLPGGHRAPVFTGIAIAAVADVPVYLVVAHGLLERPARFMLCWGLSLLGKLAWFGLAGVVAVLAVRLPRDPFLLALGAAFLAFTAHQVLRLVLLVPVGPATRK